MKITISKSNKKIGNIASFSLPSLTTCPGRTPWCEKHCYAKRLEHQYPNVRNSYANNLEASKDVDFASSMITELTKIGRKTQIIRLHVSGDFYSEQYIKDWIAIVQACPGLYFYTYTKSWMVPELLPHLEVLKSLSNMSMFASTDEDTQAHGLTVPIGWREAYAGDVKPTIPSSLVHCLSQTKKIATCDKCKICIKANLKSNIYFSTH